MKERGDKFGGNGVAEIARTVVGARFKVASVRVAPLDHKIFNDPVERETIVKALLHKLNKIIAVLRRFVTELDIDITFRG